MCFHSANAAVQADASPTFVGAAACAGCHAAETKSWKPSHHALAMQKATPATVLGDFNNATLTHHGVTTNFRRNGDTFIVRTEGPDGALRDYEIAYTFGVYPLQQYLIAFPGGRYQALGIAWDSRPKEQGGQRWMHLYPNETLAPGDRLHWTGRDQTWNYQCAACHSTDLKKNYDLAANAYATSMERRQRLLRGLPWSGLAPRRLGQETGRRGLAGEASGAAAGERHMGLTTWLQPEPKGVWRMIPDTGIAERTSPRTARSSTFAGLATRAAKSSPRMPRSARRFSTSNLPALLEAGLYHADGQIDGEVYEYGSFLQSRMHHAGVTCSDCHEPHGLTLRAKGNALCAQCHLPAKFDVASHTITSREAPGPNASTATCRRKPI